MNAAAAGTSKQKRALNVEQLQGSTGAAAKTASPPPSGPSPPTDSSAGSNIMFPIAIAGVGAVGGAAYYWNTTSSVVEEKPKGEAAPEPSETEEQPTKVEAEAQPTKVEAEEQPTKVEVEEQPTKVEASEETEKEKEEDVSRVVSIAVPDKMKNTEAPGVIIEAHPEDGNRVGMKPKSSIDDSTVTEKAISKLQGTQTVETAAALLESHQSAWSSMDASYFANLDSLSSAQLKTRVVQLATEMKDRTKWEAVRLKEFLAMKEKEMSNQYVISLSFAFRCAT
jgi:hypothetical protein